LASEEPGNPKHPGEIARRIAQVLTARRETLGVVETSAGGLISSFLTDIAGASDWYIGSVVPYSSRAKQRLLGLEPASAVSESAAMEMALACRQVFGADWVLSETGIAGPQSGRRSSKPVGLLAIAVAGREERSIELSLNGGSRRDNKLAFATASLNFLLATLEGAD
jgi:nicotinamide-nucleotide amidase